VLSPLLAICSPRRSSTPDHVHTLAAEIAWLHSYVVIFEARYGEDLAVAWNVAPGLEEIIVPRLLLQPLVENAMIHGIATTGAGTIGITVRREPAVVIVEIANSGPAVREADLVAGHGLTLVRRRLTLELPTAKLRIEPGAAGGTVVTVELLRSTHGHG